MMKIAWRVTAVLLVLAIVVVAALMTAAWTMLPLDRVALTLHGETFSLADLDGWRAAMFFVAAVALVVLALVVAIGAVAFAIALGALGLAFGLLCSIGSLALAAAPFVLVAWLLWRLVRPRKAQVVASP
ncbi:MAG: hypothetical protein ABI364_01155 [Caldimonas sp.]